MDTAKRFERILLATDGSEESQAAVDATIAIAKSPTVKVKVAHVWNLEVHHRHGHRDLEVRSEVAKLVDFTVMRLFKAGVIAERQIIRADSYHVASAMAVEAKEFGADLIVIGSRALSDWQSMTKYNISHQLLTAVDCPVLIVRAGRPGAPEHASKIVLAIAGGDELEPCVQAAVSVAQPESSVMVVHVAQAIVGMPGFASVESGDEIHKTMSSACKLVSNARVTVHGMVAHEGPVAKAVAQIAADWGADLIVIGSSRLGDIGSVFLGSMSHGLLHATDPAVLIAERAWAA
jgi:nucleotide-binding universal stress UspA family protein